MSVDDAAALAARPLQLKLDGLLAGHLLHEGWRAEPRIDDWLSLGMNAEY